MTCPNVHVQESGTRMEARSDEEISKSWHHRPVSVWSTLYLLARACVIDSILGTASTL